MTDREMMVNILKGEQPVVVTFTKKDGTERVMKCTKNFDYIPEEKLPKTTVPESDVIRVFDLEISEWRSFNIESVKDFIIE
jgi:hypothetical protein